MMGISIPEQAAPIKSIDVAALLDAAYEIDRLVDSEDMYSAAFFVEIENLRGALHPESQQESSASHPNPA